MEGVVGEGVVRQAASHSRALVCVSFLSVKILASERGSKMPPDEIGTSVAAAAIPSFSATACAVRGPGMPSVVIPRDCWIVAQRLVLMVRGLLELRLTCRCGAR